MKVLVVALGNQFDIRDAFSEVADVIYWDWTREPRRSFNSSIKYLVDEYAPDLIFIQIQTPGIISVEAAKYIAARSKVINWTGDVRTPTPQWFIDIGRHIHLTLFTNMQDVEFVRKYGVKADYLQVGFPNEIFKPEGETISGPEIIFMGNNIGGFPLSSLREDMVRKLKERYANNFSVYGINWGHGIQPITDQSIEASYYRGGKIAINLSHFNYSRYTSDRMLRIIGAGGFCLSHDYKDHELEFEPGKHIETWSNFSQLFEKIDFYLQNKDKRFEIAKEGCNHVHKEHTWSKRIEQLMKMI